MSRIACDWISDRPKLRHQAFAWLRHGFFEPRISVMTASRLIERDPQAFEDVGARLGLAQLELGAAAHHLAAEVDEVLDQLEQVSTCGRPPTMASMMMPKV